jgi:hypothetical protein
VWARLIAPESGRLDRILEDFLRIKLLREALTNGCIDEVISKNNKELTCRIEKQVRSPCRDATLEN